MKKKRDEKDRSTWVCCSCNSKEFSGQEIKVHLKEQHGIEGKVAGVRKMEMCLDGAGGFYLNQFKIVLKPSGVVLTNVQTGTKA